jgi:hypothetical protein
MSKLTKPGFGGFVTMILGIFAKPFGSNLKFVQLHFRILPKLSGVNYLGEIAMYRYLSCLIFLVATTTALTQTPIPRQGNSCPTGTYKSGDYCKPIASHQRWVAIVWGRNLTELGMMPFLVDVSPFTVL